MDRAIPGFISIALLVLMFNMAYVHRMPGIAISGILMLANAFVWGACAARRMK